MSHNQEALLVAGARRPRWHYLYFLLAAFDLLTVLFSLFVTHTLVSTHSAWAKTNALWADRLQRYSELEVLAAHVNAPGNNVFRKNSRIEEERAHLEDALARFNRRLGEMRDELRAHVASETAAPLLDSLEHINGAVGAMAVESRQIFSCLDEDELGEASVRMAAMDQSFHEATRATHNLIKAVQRIQWEHLSEQTERELAKRRYEYVIVGLIALMVLGVAGYGLKLSRAVTESEARKEVLIRAVQAEEARLRSILDNAADSIVITDEQGRIESFNAAAERLFGWRAEEAIGRNVSLLLPAPLAEDHPGYIRRYLATGESKIMGEGREVVAKRKDGTTFPLYLAVSEVRLGDRRIFTGIGRDISREKRAEETIRHHSEILEEQVRARTAELTSANERLREEIVERGRAEEKMRRLACGLDSAGESVSMTDLNGTIQYVNPAFTTLTGYSAEEAIGANHRILKSGRHSAEYYRAMWDTILRGEVWRGEIINRRKDGSEYTAHLTSAPVHDREGRLEGFVAVQRDITERKRAEEALERTNAELERKNKEMEQFVYTVSHDLKSPLVTIQGFSGHLAQDLKEGQSERVVKHLERIQNSSMHMARLIDDLLDLSRIGRITNEPGPVDLGEVIREIEERQETQLARRDIVIQVQEKMPTILADRDRLTEVFDNLLNNAIKYGCDGPEPRIEIGAEEADGEIRVFVRDHGRGIAPEYHDTVFQLFHRLDPNAEGTGVGLSIVKRIVEMHGGRAWVESAPGQGATFWVALPKRRAPITHHALA